MAFDPSIDYENYPTLAPLPDGTASPFPYIFCPSCGGTAFHLRGIDLMPVCIVCKYVPKVEAARIDALNEAILPPIPETVIPSAETDWDTPVREAGTALSAAPGFQIARGTDHTVILCPDRTVKAIGNNKNGQCNVQNWKDITAIATNQYFTVGLDVSRTVKVAGGNFQVRRKLSDWKDITSIAAGDNFVIALCSDGTVKSYNIRFPVQLGITAIAACGNLAAALYEDGSVRAVGSPFSVCKATDWSRIKAIALGGQHMVGLCEDGTVKAVGYNKKSKHEPIPRCAVDKWSRILSIAAGRNHTVALHEDGFVFAAGDNANGQCNVSEWSNVIAICADDTFTAGLCSDGSVLCTDPLVEKLLKGIYI